MMMMQKMTRQHDQQRNRTTIVTDFLYLRVPIRYVPTIQLRVSGVVEYRTGYSSVLYTHRTRQKHAYRTCIIWCMVGGRAVH
jgi:hypothetical protein